MNARLLATLRRRGYDVDVDRGSDTAAVRGHGIAVIVGAADTDAWTTLADPDAHAERRFQAAYPEAAAARARMLAGGQTVTRRAASADTFTVTDRSGAVLSPAASPDDLVNLAPKEPNGTQARPA